MSPVVTKPDAGRNKALDAKRRSLLHGVPRPNDFGAERGRAKLHKR